jgi:hypothetical protein
MRNPGSEGVTRWLCSLAAAGATRNTGQRTFPARPTGHTGSKMRQVLDCGHVCCSNRG